ncbi:hypothetical protein S245_062926 [Arachis hypogaea]|nr:Putative ribonuclease H protein [Arachis hypogaea]
MIWRFRNEYVHKNTNPHVGIKVMRIKNCVEECRTHFSREFSTGEFTQTLVNWKLPPKNWMKLNTDIASRENPGPASSAGVMKNIMGMWNWGFAKKLDSAKANEAEIEAINQGLELAWSKRIRNLIIESDSKGALDLIRKPRESSIPHSNCEEDCKKPES